MQPRLQILLAISSLFVIAIILELIRSGRLRGGYSLIWLIGAGTILLMAVFKSPLHFLADFLQISYPPSLIFMVGLGLVLTIQLLQTIIISKLTLQNRDLTQQMAIMDWSLRYLTETNGTMKSSIADMEELLTDDEEIQVFSNRARRSHLRSIEAVGPTRGLTHATEAVGAGNSRGVTEYNPTYDGSSLDLVHDGQESR